MSNNMTLGQKIRDLRISKGITQSDLGLGMVTPSMISQIESDKANPSFRVLEGIAEKLDTPLEYFISNVETQMEAVTAHKAGQALLASGSYQAALKVLESALQKDSPQLNYIDLHRDLVECQFALKQYDESMRHFKEALDRADNQGQPYASICMLNKMGLVQKQRNKYHMAVYYWQTAYGRFDELSEVEPLLQVQVLMNLGTIHREIGELDEALPYFELAYNLLRSTTEIEKMAELYLNIGLSYRGMRDYVHASEYLQYATAVFQSTANTKTAIEAKRQYGITLREEGMFEESYQVLSDCLTEYNQHKLSLEAARVHNDLAQLYLRQQKNEEAKRVCMAGLTAIPKDTSESAYLLRTLATAEAALGDIGEAIRLGEEAKVAFEDHRLHFEVSESFEQLGGFYQVAGDHAKAGECLLNMKHTMEQGLKERGVIL